MLTHKLVTIALAIAVAFGLASVATASGDCGDGIDNDGDTLIDDLDPGCGGFLDDDERCGSAAHGGLRARCPDWVCDDHFDEDGDGANAFPEDLGCADAFSDTEETACSNGQDDDGDGLIDYPEDPGCDTPADSDEVSATLVCGNGIDDDGDGLVDYPEDPGCLDPWDTTERCSWDDPECWECDDGINNEPLLEFYAFAYPSDKRIDYPDDPDCLNPMDTEKPNCWDGVDNDGDGWIDAKNSGKTTGDPGCGYLETWQTEAPECDDHIDNDGDTLIDYPADPECVSGAWWLDESAPWKAPEVLGGSGHGACGLGAELALVIPLLFGLRRLKRGHLAAALVVSTIAIGASRDASALSNWGVLASHGVNDTITAPAAFWDEAAARPGQASWFGWDPPKWIRYPAYPVASTLRFTWRLVTATPYAAYSTTWEFLSYGASGRCGLGEPLHPSPRHVWVMEEALLPPCDCPWADKAPRCR